MVVSWERDVDENGEPTGAWERHVDAYDPNAPDPDDLTAAQIGEIFGSQLGSLIAGDDPFAHVLVGSALATVLGNIGGAISYFNLGDLDVVDLVAEAAGVVGVEVVAVSLTSFRSSRGKPSAPSPASSPPSWARRWDSTGSGGSSSTPWPAAASATCSARSPTT